MRKLLGICTIVGSLLLPVGFSVPTYESGTLQGGLYIQTAEAAKKSSRPKSVRVKKYKTKSGKQVKAHKRSKPRR